MKNYEIILYTCIIIIIVCIPYKYITSFYTEGFDNATDKAEYQNLIDTMRKQLTPYCKLSSFVRSQLLIIYTSANKESDTQAAAHVEQTYRDVYNCADDSASSRPSCATGAKSTAGASFINCDIYLNPPIWTGANQDAIAINLSMVPDNLPDRIIKEIEWYASVINKLETALQAGNTPPSKVPDSENSPANNSSGKPWTVDGFTGTCSPDAAKLIAAQAAAESCTMPVLAGKDGQIARVNRILSSESLINAVKSCNALMSKMVKLQSDLQKAKDGTLYDWQQDGPKKSYAKFEGGDRKSSYIFSLKQNQ